MTYLEGDGVLSELHGAYRKDRRVEDQVFTLKGLCTLRKRQKLKTWLGFLDISKAFDTINRNRLFIQLWNKGIQGEVGRLITGLYGKVHNKVIFGSFESSWYEVIEGVKQGCILSPTLFSLAMSDLIDTLNDRNLDIMYNGSRIPCLLYDICLMADCEDSFAKMLNVAHHFATKWDMSFNDAKSKVMVIGKRINYEQRWRLGDSLLAECSSYKYLGILFSQSLRDSAHIKTYLKAKSTRLRNYMCGILSTHENINII